MAARLVLAGLAALVLGACAQTGEPQQISLTTARSLEQGPLRQTVVPAGDDFTSVTVTVGTYGAVPASAVLRLDVEGAGVTRQAFLDGATIDRDPDTVTLAFPPIERSAGEPFTLRFSADGPDPVALFLNEHDPYAPSDLSPGGGDLRFLLGHADRVEGALAAFGRVGREVGDNLADDPAFTVVWSLLVVALLAALWRGRRRQGRADDAPRAAQDEPVG